MARGNKLLGLFAAAVAAFGQTPAAPASDKGATVEGVVTNSITGEPLLRVHVSLRSQGPQASQKKYGAITTTEGKFSVTGVEPGVYTVALDKVGFVMPDDVTSIRLQPGDAKSDLKLKLIAVGAITGRVLTAEGDPLENAVVVVEIGADGNGRSTTTDAKGQYRVGGLSPGRYRVRATPQNLPVPPEVRTDGTTETHYAPTYYPGTLLPRSATRVETRAGADAGGTDIRLVRTSIVRVSGTVSGIPPGTQNVRVEVRKGRNSNSGAMVKPDGAFELWKLDPGKYTIVAAWNIPGSNTRMQSSPVDIEVADANIDRLSLNVFPAMELAVHVEFEDEKARPQPPPPPPSAPQRQGAPQAPQRAASRRVIFNAADGYSNLTAGMDQDDSFHLSGLVPARYRINLTWGPAYVKSMRLGSTHIDGAVLDLRNGAAGTALTLVVSSAMGEIAGTVTDEKGPVATAMVALVPEDWDGTGSPYRYAPTQPDGTYSLTGITPGKYRIAAVDEADRMLLMRGGNLEDYAELMESIEVHANDKLTKDLKRRKP